MDKYLILAVAVTVINSGLSVPWGSGGWDKFGPPRHRYNPQHHWHDCGSSEKDWDKEPVQQWKDFEGHGGWRDKNGWGNHNGGWGNHNGGWGNHNGGWGHQRPRPPWPPRPKPTPNPTPSPSPTPTEGTPQPTPQPTPGPSPQPTPAPWPGPQPTPQPGPNPKPTPAPWPGPQPTPRPGPNPQPTPAPWPNPQPTPAPWPGPQPTPRPGPNPQPTPRPTFRTPEDLEACLTTCPVTSEYNPVCGTDGVTYNNMGRLECAKYCGVDVQLARASRCPNVVPTSPPTPTTPLVDVQACITRCPVTSEYNPVCGTNGVTYTNPGRLECARLCGVNVQLARNSRCPTNEPVTPSPNTNPTSGTSPLTPPVTQSTVTPPPITQSTATPPPVTPSTATPPPVTPSTFTPPPITLPSVPPTVDFTISQDILDLIFPTTESSFEIDIRQQDD